MARKFLTVRSDVAKLVEDELTRRNESLKTGERKHTQQSVTEEAIVVWHETMEESRA